MFQLTEEARKDIQGIITSGYGHLPDAAFVFLQFEDRGPAAVWLNRIIPQITTAESWRPTPNEPKYKPPVALNAAFSFPGYRMMGLSERSLLSFAREYIWGLPDRAEVTGDTGASAPDRWDFGYPADSLHGLLMVYGKNEATCREWLETQLLQIRDAAGVRVITVEFGHRFDPSEEHFGFADGLSQPEIEGVKKKNRPGQTVSSTGEFIIGYPDAYGCLPPSVGVPETEDALGLLPPFPEQPEWKDFGRHGTYLVFRKLEQDVAGFWQFVQETVENLPGVPPLANDGEKEQAMNHLAAKLVGRWRSGAPLILAPEQDDPALAADENRYNDFLFMPTDPNGFVCPVAAHIRRANPRDSLMRDPTDASLKTTNRHRLVRRGIPFGERLITNSVLNVQDDGKRRGLHFIALSTNVKRQFEFIQEQWLNNARFNGLFDDKDPLVGDNNGGDVTFPRDLGRRVIKGVPSFPCYARGRVFLCAEHDFLEIPFSTGIAGRRRESAALRPASLDRESRLSQSLPDQPEDVRLLLVDEEMIARKKPVLEVLAGNRVPVPHHVRGSLPVIESGESRYRARDQRLIGRGAVRFEFAEIGANQWQKVGQEFAFLH